MNREEFKLSFRNLYSEFELPERPAPFCGSQGGSPDGILSPPMLFPHNALAAGPQARFGAKIDLKSEGRQDIHFNGKWGIPFKECLQGQGVSSLSCRRRIQSASGRRWNMNGFG